MTRKICFATGTALSLLLIVAPALSQPVTPEKRVIIPIEPSKPAPTPRADAYEKLPGARPLDMPDPSNSREMPIPPLPMPPR